MTLFFSEIYVSCFVLLIKYFGNLTLLWTETSIFDEPVLWKINKEFFTMVLFLKVLYTYKMAGRRTFTVYWYLTFGWNSIY